MTLEAPVPVDVLEGLDPGELERLRAACEERSYAPGEVVFREGETGEELHLVRSGQVRVTKRLSGGLERPLLLLGPGGAFGEMVAVGEPRRTATATALEPTTTWAMGQAGFQRVCQEDPRLGVKVLGRFALLLAERLRLTTELLRDTVRWSVRMSSAAPPDLKGAIESQAQVEVALGTGERLAGRLLKLDKSEVGAILTLVDPADGLHLVPWHAVQEIRYRTAPLALEA